MYCYDEFDVSFVNQCIEQFKDQVCCWMVGELLEDEFKLLWFMNGFYFQLYVYMLCVVIFYGMLNGCQMCKFVYIVWIYDKGYGYFMIWQNIQFNWLKLEDILKIFEELVDVEMYVIQIFGNCICNVMVDYFVGVVVDEIVDLCLYVEFLW